MRSARSLRILPAHCARVAARLCGFLGACAAATLIFASGCGAVGDACLFDSDCSGGSLCVRDMCRATCSSEDDCSAPEHRCLAVTRERSAEEETVKICVDERFDADPNGSPRDCKASGDCCTQDAQCVELFEDERARCGHDARCLIPLS